MKSVDDGSVWRADMIRIGAICALSGVALLIHPGESLAQSPSAKLCQDLQGTWQGSISGRYSGPVTITFAGNCTYSWTRLSSTNGSLSAVGKEIRYRNAAGSHGVMVRQGNQLTFRNKYTGDDYVVRVKKAR